MQINLFNSWIFSAPVILVGVYIAVFHRDTARRMADMTGYSGKEKAAAVAASIAPYPFVVLTVFIPLSSSVSALAIGALLYAAGMAGFVASVASYTKTRPGTLATHGIYQISRNPMYVAALLAFAGIAVMTLSVLLAILLLIMIILHHMMILAEERACVERFGEQYEDYRKNTPRYLLL